MSKTTLTHLFGCACAVVCVVMSVFAFFALRGAITDYWQSGDISFMFANLSLLIFGVISLATFCMTIWAFGDTILSSEVQARAFQPILKLVGIEPPQNVHAPTGLTKRSFFNLSSWQIGGILAVLLFIVGLGWYHLPGIVEQMEYGAKLQETNNAVTSP